MYADAHLLITARRALCARGRLCAAVKRVCGSSLGWIWASAQRADVLAQIVRDASQTVDAIEDRQLAERPRHSRAELASMRQCWRLQRLLAPSRRRCFRLLNRPPAWLDADAVGACANPAKNLPWR